MEEEKKIRELLEAPLKEKGYDLYSVRFSSGKEAKLEIVVDRVEPISLDDVVALGDVVSPILDDADPISGPYTLDLCSLGAEKPIALDKLPLYVDKFVNLHLSHPYKGENILEGRIKAIEEGNLILTIRDKSKKKDISFPLADVDRARLAIEF